MADNPSEHNYTCTAHCDDCKAERVGTMFHQNDSMGLATPVLFICNRCQGKGAYKLWALTRRAYRRSVVRTRVRIKNWIWAKRNPVEAARRREQVAALCAKLEARRNAA